MEDLLRYNKKVFILLFSCSLFISEISTAQVGEGSIFVRGGATLNFNNVKQTDDNSTSDLGNVNTTDINAAVGFFIIDGVAAGVSIDLQRQAIKDTDDDKHVERTISVGPFARYYTALGPFFQGQFAVGGGIDKEIPDGGPEITERFSVFSWGLGLGYPYFISDKLSLEPLLLYRWENRNWNDDEITKYRGLMVQLGLVYYIFD